MLRVMNIAKDIKPIYIVKASFNKLRAELVILLTSKDYILPVTCSGATVTLRFMHTPTCTCVSSKFFSICRHISFVCQDLFGIKMRDWVKKTTPNPHPHCYTSFSLSLRYMILSRAEFWNARRHPLCLDEKPCFNHQDSSEAECLICLDVDNKSKIKCSTCCFVVHTNCWYTWSIAELSHGHALPDCSFCSSPIHCDELSINVVGL